MIPLGARGPVPNRSEDLARPRERKGGDQTPITKGTLRPTEAIEPDAEWHPIALMLWDGALSSGQADFYQNSDLAFLYSLCEDLSLYKRATGRGRSGQMLQTIYSAMERLLITEGDRRRVRVELVAPEPEESPASVIALDEYRQGLGLVPPLPESDSE